MGYTAQIVGPVRGHALLATLLLSPLTTVAWGQALDVSGSLDLAARIAVDTQECASGNCIRLTLSIHNRAAEERFVPRRLLDVARLRITKDAREFRLAPRTGAQQSNIFERLDASGGTGDRVTKAYTLPACCVVYQDDARIDRLPEGTYVVTYEASAPGHGRARDIGAENTIHSLPATFTLAAPDPG